MHEWLIQMFVHGKLSCAVSVVASRSASKLLTATVSPEDVIFNQLT
jgi:hypothetical protein